VLVAAATLYRPDDATGRLVRAFKYDGARSLAAPLGALLAARYPWGSDVLVLPVPLHRRRLIDRGYNQAALLAGILARRRRLEWTPDTLARLRDTPTQTRLPASDRHRNLAAAFLVRRPLLVRRREVVVVDDVVTTGATADACAGTLLAAGARRVRVYAFAHTPTAAVVHAAPESLKESR
jgi:ComF family protein